MTRQTSIETYNMIKENGLLSRLRFLVYDCLYHHGPLSQTEVYTKIGGSGGHQSIAPRFAELEKIGVIYAVKERPCTITGRMVLEWDVTDSLPVKFEKPTRHKCKHCGGKGFVEEKQGRLF